jgi:ACT domain-containing protein
MKGINRTEFVKFRLSPQERKKYKQAAEEVGLSLSGFFRYSAAVTIRSIKKLS